MNTRRFFTSAVFLLACFLAAATIAVTAVRAGTRASSPGATCSWTQNGVEVDGWVCLCHRVWIAQRWEVWCTWHLASTAAKRPVRHAKRPVSRFGIGKAVLSYA